MGLSTRCSSARSSLWVKEARRATAGVTCWARRVKVCRAVSVELRDTLADSSSRLDCPTGRVVDSLTELLT